MSFAFPGADCASLAACPNHLETLLFHVLLVNYPHCAFATPAWQSRVEGKCSVLCLLPSAAQSLHCCREPTVLLPPRPPPQKKSGKRQ